MTLHATRQMVRRVAGRWISSASLDARIRALEELDLETRGDAWLQKFLPSVIRQLKGGATLSEKQVAVIQKNLKRYGLAKSVGLFDVEAKAPPPPPEPEPEPGLDALFERAKRLPLLGRRPRVWVDGDTLYIGYHAFKAGLRSSIDFATHNIAHSIGAKDVGRVFAVDKAGVTSARNLKKILDYAEELEEPRLRKHQAALQVFQSRPSKWPTLGLALKIEEETLLPGPGREFAKNRTPELWAEMEGAGRNSRFRFSLITGPLWSLNVGHMKLDLDELDRQEEEAKEILKVVQRYPRGWPNLGATLEYSTSAKEWTLQIPDLDLRREFVQEVKQPSHKSLDAGTLLRDGRKGIKFLDEREALARRTAAGKMPRLQYHATSWDRVPSILRKGIQPPRGRQDVATNAHNVPSISTTDDPDNARVYHPHGALLELQVRSGAKYLVRSQRAMRRGENLQASVDRWLNECREARAAGFWIEGGQSTVGNQTIDPTALKVLRIVNAEEAPASTKLAASVAAKYQDKKTVKKQDGGEMTVYEYSDRQIAERNKEKAAQVEKLRGSIDKLRAQIRKDLKSDDPDTKATALAIGLMDLTFERVGNSESAKEGHFGVTGWKVKHLTFGKGKVTIKYVGKSGVSHEKVVDTPESVKALKDAVKDKGENDEVVGASAEDVNAYLKPFGVSAKDIRGYHANTEMQTRLKAVRAKGKKLPTDKKEREKVLKAEFKKALEGTAEAVGHEAATLRSQYLVPGLEDDYMKDGTVKESLKKKGSLLAYPDLSAEMAEYKQRRDEIEERQSRRTPDPRLLAMYERRGMTPSTHEPAPGKSDHYRHTCPECGAVCQCRCSGPNKDVADVLCHECEERLRGSPEPVIKVAARKGDCFQAAGRYFMENAILGGDKGLRLVHGEVAGQGRLAGTNFGHAWVEDGGLVIEVSNGKNLRVPKALYYALGNISEIGNWRAYTPAEAQANMVRTGHWGPWDLKTSTGL